jgi:hypothetical protein
MENRFVSSQNGPDRSRGPFSLPFNGPSGSFPGVKRPGLKLTIYLHLVMKLRMQEAIFLHSLYSFVASTGKNLSFSVRKIVKHIIVRVQIIWSNNFFWHLCTKKTKARTFLNTSRLTSFLLIYITISYWTENSVAGLVQQKPASTSD